MKRIRLLVAVGLVILAAALNGYVYFVLRPRAIQAETQDMERLVRIYAQDTTRAVEEIVSALYLAKYQYFQNRDDRQAVFELLHEVTRAIPYVRAVGLVDATGQALHSSRGPAPLNVNIADRDYVAHFLNGGRDHYFISGPIKNVVDGRWQFTIAIPVVETGDRLHGVITAVVDPGLYSNSIAEIALPQDYVTLLDRDFRVMARIPNRESALGTSLAAAEIFTDLAASRTGAVSAVYANVFTGEQRIGAARRILSDHLVISTSRSLALALHEWRRTANIVLVVSVSMVLLGLALSQIIWRNLMAVERSRTQLAALNAQLQQETLKAERLLSVKSDFLATMSHEIRTPMNGVLGMAQALESMKMDDTMREMVSVIRDSAQSLLTVINDILDFSRLEAGKLQIEVMSVALPTLLKHVENVFLPACLQKGLALRVEIDSAVPASIQSDHVRLRQVLMNLIGNAVKFTEAGGITIRLSMQQRSQEAYVLFEVEDTGPGIPEPAIGSLFQRFTQADASIARKFGGTGLGLAISRLIVDLMGGEIGVSNRPQGGARFWFAVPADMAERDASAPAAVVARHPTRPLSELSVLYVDDNRVNRQTMQAILAPVGVQFTDVDSGQACLDLLVHRHFDIILLDIHMPDMDGFEVLRRLRRMPNGQTCPVYAATADVMPEAVARYEQSGFSGVIAKPVMIDQLIAAIAGVEQAA
jgi:two-component system sensor histidine kinase/response regulator